MSDTTGKFQKQTERMTLAEARNKLVEANIARSNLFTRHRAAVLWCAALEQRIAILAPAWECECNPRTDPCPACQEHSRAKFGDMIPMKAEEL